MSRDNDGEDTATDLFTVKQRSCKLLKLRQKITSDLFP